VILRPLISEEPHHSAVPQPIWPVIEKTQLPRLVECWLIPQPAHAALSGEIAAHLDSRYFPGLTPEVTQAIALHDAGWGMPDAAAIQASRSSSSLNPPSPKSFINFPAVELMPIWTFSIDTAQRLSPVSGYIVSQHFSRIAKSQSGKYDSKNAAFFARFEEQENRRREKLLKKADQSAGVLEPLLTALQFCDLLSLYISCGVLEDVIFPQKIDGREITLRRSGPGQCTLDPFPLSESTVFTISGVRHPKAKKPHGNAQAFTLRVNRAE
jgi:hypothetical protein